MTSTDHNILSAKPGGVKDAFLAFLHLFVVTPPTIDVMDLVSIGIDSLDLGENPIALIRGICLNRHMGDHEVEYSPP